MRAPPPPPRPADRLPHVATGEEGMISLVSLFAVLGLLVLFGALANVGRVTARKLETQNAADAVANAAGVEMARGLNAVTAANHLMGELTALCVIHHGFGGDELDNDETPQHWPSRAAVFFAHLGAVFSGAYATPVQPNRGIYQKAINDPLTGGAIRDSRIQLRYVLAGAYAAHAVGARMFFSPLPWVVAAGLVLMGTARGTQEAVNLEWRALDFLEGVAKLTRGPKKLILNVGVPALQVYAAAVVRAAPGRMELAADQVGEKNRATGRLFPGLAAAPSLPLLRLPVREEPARPRDWRRSQLVRATTPWVQHWRTTILDVTRFLFLSGFAIHYEKRTNEYTKTLTDRLREKGVRPYILEGWEPGGREKGREDWTRGTDEASREVDRKFAVVGLAHRGPPNVFSYGIYRQTNPDGMVGYAQALAYGANPQVTAPGAGFQPRLGWDTLHWNSAVREFPGEPMRTFFGFVRSVPDVPEPRVRINWQTKLVPTTRLVEALPFQQGDLGTVARRTAWWHLNLTGTH